MHLLTRYPGDFLQKIPTFSYKKIPKTSGSTLDLRRGKARFRAALKARLPPKTEKDPHQKDLFSLAQVTEDDIRAWLIAVPRFADPDSRRARAYAIGYDVAGKIAAAKAAGTFLTTTQQKESTT